MRRTAARSSLRGRAISWAVMLLLTVPMSLRATASSDLGLVAVVDGQPVVLPLLEADYQVSVSGPIARTTLRQTFTNSSGEWLAAQYRFPLPDDAAVDHLRIEAGERRVIGEIQPREAAKRTYAAARDNGQRAALVSQERANLFTTALANIAPGETVVIETEFQQPVERDGSNYQLRLPTAVTSRYASGGDGQVADASTVSMPESEMDPSSHTLSLTVDLDVGLPIAAVVSPQHRINMIQLDAGHYEVTLTDEAKLDADFALTWSVAEADTPRVALFAEQHANDHYALLQVMPPVAANADLAPPRELVLIIDTSGSMSGVSMTEAVAAAELAIDALRPADRFNLIAFSDDAEVLFPASRAAIASTVEEARGWLRSLEANGGTNMRPALAAALNTPTTSGWLRQVIFVTDGAVGNEAALFRDIGSWIGSSRLFTVGIGAAPNGWFMRQAAAVGRGRFVLTSSTGGVQNAMNHLFERMAQPVLTDIEFDWIGGEVDVYPKRIADLYAGEPIEVAAAMTGELPERLRLTATEWRGGVAFPWTYEVPLTGLATADRPGVAVHWARARLAALEDARRAGLPDEITNAAMLDVALRHHLVSSVTSLVAVDRTPVRTAGPVSEREIPGLVPRGQTPMAALTATATNAPWLRWSGLLCIALALCIGLAPRQRRQWVMPRPAGLGT